MIHQPDGRSKGEYENTRIIQRESESAGFWIMKKGLVSNAKNYGTSSQAKNKVTGDINYLPYDLK